MTDALPEEPSADSRESDGLLGRAADGALTARAAHGLEPGDWRGQVPLNESSRLPPGVHCAEAGDVFALPAGTRPAE